MTTRVTVVETSELGPREAALWAEFQQTSPATLNPFLSLTFVQTVGRARSNARVAVVELNGEIEAFLPYELGPKNIAMPIGRPMNNLQGFIGSGASFDARSVVRRAGLRGWCFDAVPAEQMVLIPHHYRGTTVQCAVIDLTEGYEFYLQGRSKSLLREAGRTRRNLEREFGPISHQWHSARPEDLRQLIGWKSDQYVRTGQIQLFSDPTARRIVEELATTGNTDCAGVLSVVFAGERSIAIRLGIAGPRILCGWFTAYDRELARFAPGTIGLFALAEDAARRGVTRFELGAGQETYKFRLANKSYAVASGAVWRSRGEDFGRKIYRRLIYDTFLRDQMPSWLKELDTRRVRDR